MGVGAMIGEQRLAEAVLALVYISNFMINMVMF